jgi:dUTP diphosphatase
MFQKYWLNSYRIFTFLRKASQWKSVVFMVSSYSIRYGKSMKQELVKICWLDPEKSKDLSLPAYQSELAAGMDVGAAIEESYSLEPGEIHLFPTGFSVAIPPGYEVQVRPRSGLAVKHGITVINSPGTIDADYRGEVRVALVNHGKAAFPVNRGDRIAQLVLAPVVQALLELTTRLDDTERGAGGFGHTGIQKNNK